MSEETPVDSAESIAVVEPETKPSEVSNVVQNDANEDKADLKAEEEISAAVDVKNEKEKVADNNTTNEETIKTIDNAEHSEPKPKNESKGSNETTDEKKGSEPNNLEHSDAKPLDKNNDDATKPENEIPDHPPPLSIRSSKVAVIPKTVLDFMVLQEDDDNVRINLTQLRILINELWKTARRVNSGIWDSCLLDGEDVHIPSSATRYDLVKVFKASSMEEETIRLKNRQEVDLARYQSMTPAQRKAVWDMVKHDQTGPRLDDSMFDDGENPGSEANASQKPPVAQILPPEPVSARSNSENQQQSKKAAKRQGKQQGGQQGQRGSAGGPPNKRNKPNDGAPQQQKAFPGKKNFTPNSKKKNNSGRNNGQNNRRFTPSRGGNGNNSKKQTRAWNVEPSDRGRRNVRGGGPMQFADRTSWSSTSNRYGNPGFGMPGESYESFSAHSSNMQYPSFMGASTSAFGAGMGSSMGGMNWTSGSTSRRSFDEHLASGQYGSSLESTFAEYDQRRAGSFNPHQGSSSFSNSMSANNRPYF